jgi:M6 family metalloprotease-like protein
MKKRIVWGILLMLCSLSLMAGPAYPGRIVYTQPDGTTIGIHLHGDEFHHWATDDAGRILEQDADGFWRVSTGITSRQLEEGRAAATLRRAAANQARQEYAAQHAAANFGSPKIPVILVGFSGQNEGFSKTAEDFDAMLNSADYTANSAIGSVRTYFEENSHGQFTPEFEVLGPVNLTSPKSYYGGNTSSQQGSDIRPEMALVHAAQALDGTVDFSRYDNDGDGTVDFVLFYFSGYDEAQGGNTNCIWSHAWYLSSSSNARNQRTFDGVKLDRYFCTAELKGGSGSTMCSIGTTCHEFAHTLGLPDFYDADYETNGEAASMYSFDLMSSGNYNANSTIPPYFTAEELYEVGWMSAIPEMAASGTVTLPAVNYPGATGYSAFMTKAAANGEYFVYEVRGGQRWDAPLPQGMMVYHVDKSANGISGTVTAASTWSNNSVNNYSAHPCCYMVPAVDPTRTTLYSGTMSNFFFPGTGLVRTYSPTGWNGNSIGYQLTNIAYDEGNRVVTFNVSNTNALGISGTVMDTDSNPIAGATVTITAEEVSSSAPARTRIRVVNSILTIAEKIRSYSSRKQSAGAAQATLVTDSEGYYMAEVPAGTYQVTVSKDGYQSRTLSVTVASRIETLNFYLFREGEEAPSVLYAWPSDYDGSDARIVGFSASSWTAQNQYPSSEIGRYAGKQIKEIKFYLYGEEGTTYEGVNVMIDYDDDRKATIPVNSVNLGGYTTVDLRDAELVIPANKDIFAGVGFSRGGYYENGYYYSFCYIPKSGQEWGADWPYDGFYSSYNLASTDTRTSVGALFEFYLTIGDYEAPDTGYNYIADPKNGRYSAGEVFDLTLVETEGARKPGSDIAWYLDDEPVSGPSVTLSAGTHVVEARFSTTEGKQKVVELTLTVE